MPKHALVVGGTGMLANVTKWLADVEGFHVSVIGRDKIRLEKIRGKAKRSNSIHTISVEYHNLNKLSKKISNAISLRGPICLAITWIHYTAPDTLNIILEENSKNVKTSWRLFNIRGRYTTHP